MDANNSLINMSANASEAVSSDAEFIVEGIIIPIISFLGLVGNILSICVLRSSNVDMKVISYY